MNRGQRRGQYRVMQCLDPPVVDRRRVRQVQLDDLDQEQLRHSRRRLEPVGRDLGSLLQGIVDACLHPFARRACRRAHDEHGRENLHPGVEQRVLAGQVTADHTRRLASLTVPDHRHPIPRRRVQQGRDRHAGSVGGAAHSVFVVVREDDDITCAGPVALPVGLDPTATGRDHVEEKDVSRTRRENRGCVSRRDRLVCPGFGVLPAQEDRPT
jgi:hypothetical protein